MYREVGKHQQSIETQSEGGPRQTSLNNRFGGVFRGGGEGYFHHIELTDISWRKIPIRTPFVAFFFLLRFPVGRRRLGLGKTSGS